MKPKTIKSVLRKKMNSILESIDDDKVRELMSANTIITGGSIASMLLQEKVNDFDLYFKDIETTEAVAKYYVKKFNENPPVKYKDDSEMARPFVKNDAGRIKIVVTSSGIASASDEGNKNYEYFEMSNPNAGDEFVEDVLNAAEDAKASESEGKYRPVFMSSNAITLSNDVQIVIRFYGQPDQIHTNFDFEHCTCSWDSLTSELRLPEKALTCLLSRELIYRGS
mgnify:CR=1 FL=1